MNLFDGKNLSLSLSFSLPLASFLCLPTFFIIFYYSGVTSYSTTIIHIWSEWRLTVIAATVRIALVDILDLSEVDIPAGVFLHPAVGWG